MKEQIYNKLNYPKHVVTSFWARIIQPVNEIEDCWEWEGPYNNYGYGKLNFSMQAGKYQTIGAHRFSWEFYNGAIQKGLLVCHKCDNPPCVNPNHLFLGTDKDNKIDNMLKERHYFGSKHYNTILEEQDIRNIITNTLNNKYNSINDICTLYNVSYETIRFILVGQTWKHITKEFSDVDLKKVKDMLLNGNNRHSLDISLITKIKDLKAQGYSNAYIQRNLQICNVSVRKYV
jgi:hypothetical protein